ncbi:DUF3164 family protein [Ectopseudomonas oleovorans]|uniref:Sulfate transporter n=1 Tax=Ectopseudomonas oleovorans (strain CECT 5344) TaxID=1182590 RepID=W6R003_ECTO5|nr:DUF3164 family protein [Pseudomonas oleovorans]CDM42415.1 hypothetical protein BN5_3873 [Pseudomonas oleovorans CECT 5344]CDR93038.1 hypothetical protein PPSAL_3814 [Pseudomonas oleovorans]
MNAHTQPIPEGYRRDAQGRLVHESMIKPIDQERDRLVMHLVDRASELSNELADFKGMAFGDVRAFIEMSFEEYGAKIGGKKGNVTLHGFDGRYKVQISVQETTAFDERLQAARALIDECLAEWTQGARPEVVTLVNDAFRTDTKGEIRTARVLALHRLEIADERWQRAMKAISDSCQAVGSKSYLRFYERVGDSDQYRPISLDIAAIALPEA